MIFISIFIKGNIICFVFFVNTNSDNIYENNELNDNMKPHDIFFTPHFLTLDDVLYWEFKAG